MEDMVVDHIGIAVDDLERASETFSKLLGIHESRRETVESEGVEIVVFDLDGARIELLGTLGEDGPIAKFIRKRGPGIHHIAIRCGDPSGHADNLTKQGFNLLGKIRKGGEGRDVFFLPPAETSGVLLEFTSPPEKASDTD
jgi:methylmalonyl-CoA/ethylmalonyl-CoA epimerase